jgi:trehalose 6-phosphate phosphatase
MHNSLDLGLVGNGCIGALIDEQAEIVWCCKRLEPPPRRIGGKFVENLIPHGMPDKGEALLHLMRHTGCSRAFFLGDDETDEDVFKLDLPQIFSACVGRDRTTAARYVVEQQVQTAQLIQELSRMQCVL